MPGHKRLIPVRRVRGEGAVRPGRGQDVGGERPQLVDRLPGLAGLERPGPVVVAGPPAALRLAI